MKDIEDNPSLKKRFGEKVAQRVKAQRKQEQIEKAFKDATRRFRPRSKERGKIVLIAATKTRSATPGKRVDSSYRGKVYAFYVTKSGRVRPYREATFTADGKRRVKHKVPRAYRPATLDPQQFPTRKARQEATEIFVRRGDKLVPAAVVEATKGSVPWMEVVVPLAANRMNELAMKATGGRGVGNLPMMVEVKVTVEMTDGQQKTVKVVDDFGQKREQGAKEKDFYAPFLAKKTYALVAQELQMHGLVSQGSARRVAKANVGRKRKDWQWRGGPWYKRDMQVARVKRVEVQPYLKLVGRRTKK